jgi:polysaccharide export outer membrane protein
MVRCRRLKDSSVVALSVGITLATVLLGGCVAKGITKPRSEIIEQAISNGQEIASIEEDRERFFGAMYEQQDKLLTLLQQRSSGGSRDANYRIGPQDELEINVFDVPELNLTARVGQSGFISLPLVGGVQALNLTEAELQKELTKRLSSYVRQPQVSVVVSHFGSQKVAVLGAVDKPGTYPLKKGTNSIIELISEAGGVSTKAGNYINFVPVELSGVSSSNDAEARARFALQSQAGGTTAMQPIEVALENVLGTSGGIPIEIPIRGGDMIIVPEGGKVMVEGEVTSPGAFELGQRMTLLGALAAASGVTYSAKLDEIEVVREASLQDKYHLVVSMEDLSSGKYPDIRLKNGDIVRVPSASGRRMSQDTFEGIAKMINFGIGGNVALAN